MNLYGAPGMGAAGTGMGAGPMVPGAANGMSPQLMQLIQALRAGGGGMQGMGMPGAGMPPGAGGGPVAPPPGPIGSPSTGTPMANYIGAGGGGMGMQQQHPMMQPQQMQPPGGAMAPGPNTGMQGAMTGASSGMINPQMLQMLQMLKGQQTGVPAGGAAGATPPPAAPPAQMAPGMGGGTGPMAPWLDQLLRSQGAYGGVTGGAPT